MKRNTYPTRFLFQSPEFGKNIPEPHELKAFMLGQTNSELQVVKQSVKLNLPQPTVTTPPKSTERPTTEEMILAKLPVLGSDSAETNRGGSFVSVKAGPTQVSPFVLNAVENPYQMSSGFIAPGVFGSADIKMGDANVSLYGLAAEVFPPSLEVDERSALSILGVESAHNMKSGVELKYGANMLNGEFNQVEGAVSIPLNTQKKGPIWDPFTGEIIDQ